MRRALALVALLGGACLNTVGPDGFVFQYRLSVVGCDSDCTAPDTTPTTITSADLGDTVWVRHDIMLVQAFDSTRIALVRPECAENVWIRSGATLRDTLPTPTCPDSVAARAFLLGTRYTRFNQWIVDSSLALGEYFAVGRVLVQPRVEPAWVLEVQ